MKSLKIIYQDAPADVRYRVPIFNGIIVVLFLLSLIIIASDISVGASIKEILEHCSLSVVSISAWYFTRKGFYRIVSDAYFVFVELTMLILRLIDGYTGSETFGLYAAILGSFLVFGAIFIDSRIVLFGLCGIYGISFFAYIAFIVIFRPTLLQYGLLSVNIAYPTIAVLAIIFGLISTRLIVDRILSTMHETVNNTRKLNENNRIVAAEAARHLSKADSLAEGSRKTSDVTGNIKDKMNRIVEKIGNLDKKIGHAETIVDTLKSAANGLNEISREQAISVNESTATFTQMTASIQSTSRIIETRSSGVNNLITTASEGEKAALKSVESFTKVSSYVNSIREMATVISDIADRTNLLAMNASIQAAHAGEAGRGFAVVAGEIRSLAESSATSANGIAENISELIRSIEETGGTVNTTGNAFRNIVDEIKKFSQALQEIVGNVKELEIGTNEINTVTTNLNSISQQVDEKAQHVSESQETFAADLSTLAVISREITEEIELILSDITTARNAVKKVHTQAEDLLSESKKLTETMDDEKRGGKSELSIQADSSPGHAMPEWRILPA